MAEPFIGSRARFLAVIVGFTGLVFLARLFQLQVIKGSYFNDLAGSQYSASRLYGMYDRGTIFLDDRSGRQLTIAGLSSGYTLAINPKLIINPTELYDKLVMLIPELDKDTFIAKASDTDDPYEEILHKLNESIVNKLKILQLKGVLLVKERWRSYPGESLAAEVLGFVGWQDNVLSGRYRVEKYYDNILSREPSNVYQNFFSQIFSGATFNGVVSKGDVVLTIEPKVQALVESKAMALIEKWGAKKAGILVLDPKNGDIIAMALSPTFNPNKYGEVSDIGVFKNSFVEDVFEMGSIMKPITMASAIDAGVINNSTTYVDNGFVELDGRRIENFDSKGRGRVDMQEVLNQSLNTGAVFAALMLGPERFREYMYRFGFQDKTGIDLPGEGANLVNNLESQKKIEIATASFGQGIAVTPIAIARALAALGNGGFLIKPRIVKRITTELGYSDKLRVTEQGRAISGKTSEEITHMLVKVVDEALLGGKIKMDHYSIAAKTGTAQIASPDGGYYTDRYLHSFFAYFPAYNPQFLVFIFLREPNNVRYASETLTLPFRDIAEYLLNYYEVLPDR